MDIFEFAMQMEKDGQTFYEKQAAATRDTELKKILLALAEEEQQHYKYFQRLSQGETDLPVSEMRGNLNTLNKVKNIFHEMSQSPSQTAFGDDERSIWQQALKIEEKAEKFYREKAEVETDKAKKQMLNLIANEEQRHIHMIDGVLSYLKFPDDFAQSAQFRNFQSLEGH